MNNNTHTQLEVLNKYEFSKTEVLAGNIHTLDLIALKPVVQNLGLNWSGAHQKIMRDLKLSKLCVTAKQISTDGKSYEMVCMSPTNFQNWLWSLTPTANMNVTLWEEYKKGLVIYILEMLKISLDEIKRLRFVQKENEYLKSRIMMSKELGEKAKQASVEKREGYKMKKEIDEELYNIAKGEGSNQMTMF